MNVLYQNKTNNGTLTFYEAENLIIIKLYNEIEVPEYKDIFENFLKMYPVDKRPALLFDCLSLKKSPIEGRAWFSTDVIPRFKKLLGNEVGFKIALCQSSNAFQRMAAQIILKATYAVGFKFNIKEFSTIEDGKTWLKSRD
jgi:hypothetical protein